MASPDFARVGGVKGLVDVGIKELPQLFHAPTHFLNDNRPLTPAGDSEFAIPIIDLEGATDVEKRKRIIEKVRDAAENWGFFQILNHGVPVATLDEMKAAAHRFFDQDVEQKKEFFRTDLNLTKNFFYTSDYALAVNTAAQSVDWRDSIIYDHMAPEPGQISACIREILMEFSREMLRVGGLLLGLLSEALGLTPNHLEEIMGCTETMRIGCNYYPVCPQPELALGITPHSDLSFISILLQDHVGGLQVSRRGCWVDVPPVPEGLLINVVDIFQLISNDKFARVEHRVVLKSNMGPRVSIAAFFGNLTSSASSRIYGPIKELVSEDNPPKYRETTIQEFFMQSFKKRMDGTSILSQFKLRE